MTNTLKTTNIKGKMYVPVNERLKYFRENFEGYALVTEVIEANDQTAMIRAVIRNKEDRIVATGVAYERANAPGSMVNKTNHIENCETSAWGRALGNFGIGIDASVASADEVQNALDRQHAVEEDEPTKAAPTRAPRKPTPEAANPVVSSPALTEAEKATPAEITHIAALCKETGTDQAKMFDHYKVVGRPTKAQAATMLRVLNERLSKQIDAAAKANS